MNKVAIAFSTKDRVDLSRRTIEPLLQPGKFDTWWFDGSDFPEGRELPLSRLYDVRNVTGGVRGGADATIVYALTTMLSVIDDEASLRTAKTTYQYDYVGLCENDVLLHPDWFGSTFALFERGRAEGLEVGAVSARAYEDRVLIQRDAYAVMHNLGAGHVIFSRRAAELILQYYRTGWTLENRRVFAQLSGQDIGRYWAFRGAQSHLTADWHFDTILAAHGLASLALTPGLVEMIGQDPSLHEQGLYLVEQPVDLLRDDKAFGQFCDHTQAIRDGALRLPMTVEHVDEGGSRTYFAHQVPLLGGSYDGTWRLRWSQGFGPFAWEAGRDVEEFDPREPASPTARPSVAMQISGPCSFLVSGGTQGGRARVTDEHTGYDFSPELPPEQVLSLAIPAAVAYRTVRLTALTPGCRFYGVTTREQQPVMVGDPFDHSWLPPVAP